MNPLFVIIPYILIWLFIATPIMAYVLENPQYDMKDLDIGDMVWYTTLGAFWPAIFPILVIAGIFMLVGFASKRIAMGIEWGVKELKNPKENI